jgi:hypothetical protein
VVVVVVVVVAVMVLVVIAVVGKHLVRVFTQLYATDSIVLRVFSPTFTRKTHKHVSGPRQLE